MDITNAIVADQIDPPTRTDGGNPLLCRVGINTGKADTIG